MCYRSFTPPAGLKRATGSGAQLSQFDSETLRQKLATGCQLWAIRLPEGVSSLMPVL